MFLRALATLWCVVALASLGCGRSVLPRAHQVVEMADDAPINSERNLYTFCIDVAQIPKPYPDDPSVISIRAELTLLPSTHAVLHVDEVSMRVTVDHSALVAHDVVGMVQADGTVRGDVEVRRFTAEEVSPDQYGELLSSVASGVFSGRVYAPNLELVHVKLVMEAVSFRENTGKDVCLIPPVAELPATFEAATVPAILFSSDSPRQSSGTWESTSSTAYFDVSSGNTPKSRSPRSDMFISEADAAGALPHYRPSNAAPDPRISLALGPLGSDLFSVPFAGSFSDASFEGASARLGSHSSSLTDYVSAKRLLFMIACGFGVAIVASCLVIFAMLMGRASVTRMLRHSGDLPTSDAPDPTDGCCHQCCRAHAADGGASASGSDGGSGDRAGLPTHAAGCASAPVDPLAVQNLFSNTVAVTGCAACVPGFGTPTPRPEPPPPGALSTPVLIGPFRRWTSVRWYAWISLLWSTRSGSTPPEVVEEMMANPREDVEAPAPAVGAPVAV